MFLNVDNVGAEIEKGGQLNTTNGGYVQTFVEPVRDAVVNIVFAPVVCDLHRSGERIRLEIQVVFVHERLQHQR